MNTRPKGAFRFTAKDFERLGVYVPEYSTVAQINIFEAAANRANALLEAHEAKCGRVYSGKCYDFGGEHWLPENRADMGDMLPTHTALLWNVEKIGEEK